MARMELSLAFILFAAFVLMAETQPAWGHFRSRSRSRQRRSPNDETFFLSKLFREKFDHLILKPDKHLQEDFVTPFVRGEDPDLPRLSFKETCPSRLVVRYNRNRRPEKTIEASCETQECINIRQNPYTARAAASTSRVITALDPATPVCQPVVYYRWVKVRATQTCGRGRKKARRCLLPVPVGCTCVARPDGW